MTAESRELPQTVSAAFRTFPAFLAVRPLLKHAALALAYVLTGWFGLYLAVPPGYATAVFLPAGIAVAAVLVAGTDCVAAVFVGSLVLNIWTGYASFHTLDALHVGAALIIAFGSTAQAAAGGALLRWGIGYPAPLDNPRDVSRFLLLTPLFCLTSVGISLSGMWLIGVVPSSALPINAMTWWVGDTLGVIVSLPIVLVLFGEPRALWRLRLRYVALPMLVCFALFVAIFMQVNRWEHAHLIQALPIAGSSSQLDGWQAWTVLVSGVFCTGLLGALLLLGSGHAYRFEKLAQLLHAREAELENIINRTPFMLIRCSPDLHYRFVSPAYAEMLGRQPQDIVGKALIEIVGQEGFAKVRPHIAKVLRGERAEYEHEVEYEGVGRRFLRGIYTPDMDENGRVVGWIASIVDLTDRKRAEEQRDLLMAEINHRVKNTLATVISIARQSFAKDRTFEVSQRSFTDRIQALAQTHTRLAEANWSGMSLESIIRDEVAPYRGSDNVRIAGPNLTLSPKQAVSLGLAFHELTTNAAKYGALSVKGGLVQVEWEIAAPGEVRLTWIETGGPAVKPPGRSGFGRLLLERALAADLGGSVALSFRKEGLHCLIVLPLNPFPVKPKPDSQLAGAPQPPGERARPADPPAGFSDLTAVRVLVVEDEALVALELHDLLNKVGATVIGPFGDLTQAREISGAEAIDLAVLDTNLNGEAVYPLARDLLHRGIPFVFVSGYNSGDVPAEFRTLPRIAKPFDPLLLLKELQRAKSQGAVAI
jgi:PAS domain S-box-containing protein